MSYWMGVVRFCQSCTQDGPAAFNFSHQLFFFFKHLLKASLKHTTFIKSTATMACYFDYQSAHYFENFEL